MGESRASQWLFSRVRVRAVLSGAAPFSNTGSAVPKPPLIHLKPEELRHKGIKRTAQRSHRGARVKFGNCTFIS